MKKLSQKIKRAICGVCCITALCSAAAAQIGAAPQPDAAPAYAVGAKLYVATEGVAFRKGPSTDSERIHYLPKGEPVAVCEDNRPPVPFNAQGVQGYWLYVRHGAYKGYVVDAFLTDAPPPIEDRLDWLCIPGRRVGPITYKTTYADLIDQFGESNLAAADVPRMEEPPEPGTAVFPDSPNRLLIRWKTYQRRPEAVIVDKMDSRWKLPNGIAVGAPLAKLVALNGKPVSFFGFGFDGHGVVCSWNGGALEKDYPLNTQLTMSLDVPTPRASEDYSALLGDAVYTSEAPAATRLALHVARIVIYLDPAPEALPPAPAYPNALAARAPYAPVTPLYVLATALNMRQDPSSDAPVVDRIPYGTKVSVMQDTRTPVPLLGEGMHGHWLAIESAKLHGYVFDAYLSPLPAPPPNCVGLWDYADSVLGKLGAEREDHTTAGSRNETWRYQDYKYDARIQDRTWTSGAQSGHDITLIVRGLSMEQAFVLAMRCERAFAGADFSPDPNGTISLEGDAATLTIRSELDGVVSITYSTHK